VISAAAWRRGARQRWRRAGMPPRVA
jgi:hypothetical protein